jgi:hypothetical protein
VVCKVNEAVCGFLSIHILWSSKAFEKVGRTVCVSLLSECGVSQRMWKSSGVEPVGVCGVWCAMLM